MISLLRRLLSPPPVATRSGPLVTDDVVSVLGDVHGCDGLLARILPRLPGQVVAVGDLIDRGERSAAVIDHLIARPEVICLMGNHEAMLLAFLDDPVGNGPRWLRNGGLQTLASFGVGGDLSAGALPRRRDALARSMGDDRIDWLRARPMIWHSGTLVVTHAGADPARPIDAQEPRHLMWGHPDFETVPRRDGLWIARGHVIVPEGTATAGRIAVDTGAYATGRLTAAVIGDGEVAFETA